MLSGLSGDPWFESSCGCDLTTNDRRGATRVAHPPPEITAPWYHCDTSATFGGRFQMANVLIRNLDDHVLEQLKTAAKAHGRSLQAEIHDVLHNASARR